MYTPAPGVSHLIGTRRRTEGRHDEGRYQGMGQHEGAIAGGRKEAKCNGERK